VSKTGWLFETARKLGEARHILEGVEATALSGVAQMLAQTAESLARTARELKGIVPDEWLTFEEAAAYLGIPVEPSRDLVVTGSVSLTVGVSSGSPCF
jgi:hypothetical protein